MSDSSYIQEIIVSTNENKIRVSLDWDRLIDFQVGKVVSLARDQQFWVSPDIASSLSAHSHKASHLILLKSKDGCTTLVLYPVSTSDVNNVFVIEDGKIKSNLQRVSLEKTDEIVWVICVEAKTPVQERRSVSKAIKIARGLVGSNKVDKSHDLDIFDQLGVCTWESFKQPDGSRTRPTLDLLLSIIPKHPIGTYLIDDGWQDVSPERKLNSFNAYSALGATLSETVEALKDRGVGKVGVWMTLQGYWEGIHPSSELVEKYHCKQYQVGKVLGGLEDESEPSGKTLFYPSPEKAGSFWEDYLTTLKESGIDFVKIDNQGYSEMAVDPAGLHLQRSLFLGCMKAVEKVFGLNAVIVCMAHNERMLNGPGGLNFDRPSDNLIFRNSDDFAIPLTLDHTDHIYMNLYTSILTSNLALIPDFDMLASSPKSQWPIYHALLRSLGPGPVLLSDTPHDIPDEALISRMTGETKDGVIKVIKATNAAQVLSRRWFSEGVRGSKEGPALVAGSKFGEVGGIIGAWNVHHPNTEAIAKDQISWEDVEDLLDLEENSASEYLLSIPLNISKHSQKQESNSPIVTLVNASDQGTMDIELEKGESEMVVVSKVYNLHAARLAIVGLKGKFASLAGIEHISTNKDSITFRSTYSAQAISIILIGEEDISSASIKASMDGVDSKVDVHAITIRQGTETVTGRLIDLHFPPESNQGQKAAWDVEIVLGH
ncbi:uncharacterized protein IL334_000727 [Kwoniella shivajii]|uniref:Alpha-galactosidase n=1 Tax=Kwoniella shivajii TaxID=564305 RepID=A0ABZ1CPY9_9TREE|nr:hypothetical protein IL334_000727 [Kwoniella shivajii]